MYTTSARGVGHAAPTRDRNYKEVDCNAHKIGYMYTATKQQRVVSKVTQNPHTLEVVAVSLTNRKSSGARIDPSTSVENSIKSPKRNANSKSALTCYMRTVCIHNAEWKKIVFELIVVPD